MFLKPSKWILSGLVVVASSFANASTLTLNVENATQNGSDFGNSFTKNFSANGETQTLTITAWADTKSADGSSTDLLIEAAEIGDYPGGLGISNNTSGDGHTADNYQSNPNERDYDFFLLDFGDLSVTLNSITSGYLEYGASSTQVSVAAVTTGDLADKTWNQVDNNFSLSSGYGQFMGNSGSYYVNSFTSEAGEDLSSASSTRWIVGAFNHHFGGDASLESNDGFKLASIGFTTKPNKPGTSIPEPAPLALMLVALVALARRKVNK
ncbi:exosortase-dependent surface protein XDP1 [Thalassotalea euphylliae]|uniref:exosortase-dependent surface protein XDP1 n=1 Tax=Thalassotalea euphylliae TaxID=1655234 RepID=UPI0011C0629C|nr:exosortase-dependent surface protein XDP1 [Thalassotalea euphylliae]